MSAVGLVSVMDLAATIERAADVSVSAYVLGRGRMERALETAGDRGAAVSVQMEGDFSAASAGRALRLRAFNEGTAAALRAHHVRVDLRAGPPPELHIKACVVDGVAYFDDRNWCNADGAVVRSENAGDVAAARDALRGVGRSGDALATRKDRALALEADAIERAPPGATIRCASESFGPSAVAGALEARARAGGDVRVLVDRREASEPGGKRERGELARLRAAGAQVRLGERVGKEAVAGSAAWLGSANATATDGAMLDWGMRSGEPAIVDAVARDFDAAWNRAKQWIA